MKAYTPDEAGNPGPVFGGAFEVDEELDYAGICDDVFSWEGMTFCHVFVFQKKTSTFSIFHFLHTKLNIRKKNITINIESISCFFLTQMHQPLTSSPSVHAFPKRWDAAWRFSFRGKSGVPHERREEDTKNGVRFAFLKYEVDGL